MVGWSVHELTAADVTIEQFFLRCWRAEAAMAMNELMARCAHQICRRAPCTQARSELNAERHARLDAEDAVTKLRGELQSIAQAEAAVSRGPFCFSHLSRFPERLCASSHIFQL